MDDINVVRRFLNGTLICALAVGLLPAAALAQNPIVLENQNPGSSAWTIDYNNMSIDATGQMQGYASAVSVNKGDSINFFVSVNTPQTYTIDVFRAGYYQGLGARLMQHIGPLSGITQPSCPPDATTGLIACNWALSYTLATQTTWTSGVYLALLTNSKGFQGYISFTLRDDTRVAPLLYAQPVTTYQAYNDWPYDLKTGKSLYAFNSYGANTISAKGPSGWGGANAVKVSFDRPYGEIWGLGFTQDGAEFAFVRWMEKQGYDVTYVTDVDVHANPSILLNYKGVISAGHDEYWSKARFQGVTAAIAGGINYAIFGQDTAGWQVRYESSASGAPNRVVVCYRDQVIDPTNDPTLETVQWINPILNLPGQTFSGLEYNGQLAYKSQYDGYAPFVVQNASHWIFAGSGFVNGTSVPGLVGYEADNFVNSFPTPGAAGTYTLVASSPFSTGSANLTQNAMVYQSASGAWVFNSGTEGWSRGLDNFSGWGLVNAGIQTTTANILNKFIGAASFSLGATPTSQTVAQGGAASYSVTVTPSGGFSDSVTLSVSGFPTGATGTFTINPATATSTLNVATLATTPNGTSTLTITGVSGTSTKTTTVTLIVATPNFTLGATPSSQSVIQGTSTSYAVTITPSGGFTGAVALSVSGLPADATGTFTTNPATSTSTLNVTTAADTPLGSATLTITGVSGSLTKTATVALVVNPIPIPSFTIGATPPSQSVTQGASVNYPVTITPAGGFTGSVTLSVDGLPAGATGTFSTNPATATSTLTVTTVGTTPVGPSTLTISGISGSLTASTTVSLTVNAPAVIFDNKVSSGVKAASTSITTPAFTIGSGANRAAMIMVTMAANTATGISAKLGGISGTLVPGTDTGTTATIRTMIFQVINPPSGSQTATVAWTKSMKADVGVITVSGANQTTPVINGRFAASSSSTAATSVTVTSSPGDLTASVAYTTGTWLSPFTNQTLKWGIDSSVAGGDIGPGTGTTTHTWTDKTTLKAHAVSAADFKVLSEDQFSVDATPASQSVAQGSTASYPVTITPVTGFTGEITLSVSGLPAGATGTFTPNPATTTSTLNITTLATTPTGTSTLTITGVSGGETETSTVALVVTAGASFTVGATPSSQSIAQGASTSYPVTITPTGGFAGSVTLSVSGLPTGATGTFTTNPATTTSTLNITSLTTTPTGSSTLTITGVSGTITQTATVTLVVTPPPSFTLGATPSSQSVGQGASSSYPVTITPTNGFTGSVTLSVSGLPTGATGTFTINPATTTSTLNVTTLATTPTGSSTLTITGVSGTITQTATVTLVVTPPASFTLGASPASQTILQGGATSYPVTITPSGGFSGAVTLSVSGLPTGATGTFTTNPATSTSTLNVTTVATTPTGSSVLTISGVNGTITQTAMVTLVVNAGAVPSFTLGATPSSQTVTEGGSTSYPVTITPSGGFTGSVTLSVSGLPTGATGTFTTNPATATSTLNVSTLATTPTGSSTLTITGVSGAITQTATVALVVNAAGSGKVVFDNKATSGFKWGAATATTAAFTIGTGANRAAMIMVAMSANTATNVKATLGGVAGTLVPGTDTTTTSTSRTMIFEVINPPSGSQTATVTWTGSMNADIGVITVSGANQTTPVINGTFTATKSSAATATSLTVTSAPGDLTATYAYTEDAWKSPYTNQTLKVGIDSAEVGGDIGPGTGTTTHTWTDTYAGQTISISGADFAAAP